MSDGGGGAHYDFSSPGIVAAREREGGREAGPALRARGTRLAGGRQAAAAAAPPFLGGSIAAASDRRDGDDAKLEFPDVSEITTSNFVAGLAVSIHAILAVEWRSVRLGLAADGECRGGRAASA